MRNDGDGFFAALGWMAFAPDPAARFERLSAEEKRRLCREAGAHRLSHCFYYFFRNALPAEFREEFGRSYHAVSAWELGYGVALNRLRKRIAELGGRRWRSRGRISPTMRTRHRCCGRRGITISGCRRACGRFTRRCRRRESGEPCRGLRRTTICRRCTTGTAAWPRFI